MSDEKPQKELLGSMQEVLNRFKPGGDRAPIQDRYEYERQMESLPPEEKEYAQEATRMADLLQYCSHQGFRIPPGVPASPSELPPLSMPSPTKPCATSTLCLLSEFTIPLQIP